MIVLAAASAAAVLLSPAGTAQAQVDYARVLVNKTNAVGSGDNAIGAFGYDPTTDAMYVTAFQAGGGMRKVTDVSDAAKQASAVVMGETALQLFYRDGNPDRGVSTPLQNGLLLNPKPIGSAAAYSFALVADGSTTRFPGSTTADPAATKRIYSYNLQPALTDGRTALTSRVTLAQIQAANGTSSTAGAVVARQFAWSGDGQSIFWTDTSSHTTANGGFWKAAATGTSAPVRLAAEDDVNTEPAVVSAGGIDRIYVRGGGSTANVGGIDAITHDGTTTGARRVAVSAAALRDFFEWPATGTPVVASMAADAGGNVYFNNTAAGSSLPERRGLYRLDPQGRLSKVLGYAERQAAFGGSPQSPMLRQQPRTVTYAGPGGPYDLTQILYVENHLNSVVAADAFRPGDFDRDNQVGPADLALLKPRLTTRGVAQTSTANLRFDLNGSATVDWKDVKILQQFYPALTDGDADMGGAVDYADLDVMAAGYPAAGRTWTQGEFTGDDRVDLADLRLVAANWDLPTPTSNDFAARGYTGAFRTDAERAFGIVPEPGSIGLAALAAVGLLAKRRRRV